MEADPDALAVPGHAAVVRAAKDITFGSIAGIFSKIFEHPFDLTKVRLQSQVMDTTARFSGPMDCLKQTWTKEGIAGLYRGLPAPIVGAMAENASLFLAYSEFQNAIRWASAQPLSEELSIPQLCTAAAGAGAVTSFLLTPIELVKCKMQVQMLVPVVEGQPPAKLPGPFGVLSSVIKTTGFKGLWLGHMGTFIRETGGSAAWFGCKEAIGKVLVKRRQLGKETTVHDRHLLPWESAFSGACAGASYNLAFFPADTVKSTMQTEEELRPRAAGVKPLSFGEMAKEMYKKQGIRGLYAGCGITIARSIPSSAIIFLIYDGLKKHFG